MTIMLFVMWAKNVLQVLTFFPSHKSKQLTKSHNPKAEADTCGRLIIPSATAGTTSQPPPRVISQQPNPVSISLHWPGSGCDHMECRDSCCCCPPPRATLSFVLPEVRSLLVLPSASILNRECVNRGGVLVSALVLLVPHLSALVADVPQGVRY